MDQYKRSVLGNSYISFQLINPQSQRCFKSCKGILRIFGLPASVGCNENIAVTLRPIIQIVLTFKGKAFPGDVHGLLLGDDLINVHQKRKLTEA